MNDKNLQSKIDLLVSVTKDLVTLIYKSNAKTIFGSYAKELENVKTNFQINKLGLEDTPELDEKINLVIELIEKF